jgi:hypothetical protein
MDDRGDVLVEPLSLLVSELTEIATKIQSVYKSHSARMEAACCRASLLIEVHLKKVKQT